MRVIFKGVGLRGLEYNFWEREFINRKIFFMIQDLMLRQRLQDILLIRCQVCFWRFRKNEGFFSEVEKLDLFWQMVEEGIKRFREVV